jgi:hypothetical protein
MQRVYDSFSGMSAYVQRLHSIEDDFPYKDFFENDRLGKEMVRRPMTQLMVRNLSDDLVKALKQRAAKRNRGAERSTARS